MGNQGSKEEKQPKVEKKQLSINHPHLKNSTLMIKKGEKYIETIIPIREKKDYYAWVEGNKESPANKSEYTLKPLDSSLAQQQMCGNGATAKIQYQFFPYLLSSQIQQRKEAIYRKFEQTQIWYLLYCLCDGASNYHEKGMKLGDIRPINVFLSDDRRMRVATKDSWPEESTSYEKSLYQKQKAYLAPEEINQIVIGAPKPSSNPERAESFSVGLTCLDSILLETSNNIYRKNGFDFEVLEGKQENMKNEVKYSSLLKFVILGLTNSNSESRVTCQQVHNWLKAKEKQILNYEAFEMSHLPPKIQLIANKNEKLPIHLGDNPEVEGNVEGEGALNEQPMKMKARAVNNAGLQSIRASWAEIEEKIRKSREMFPS